MGRVNFEIVYDNSYSVFRAGQSLIGKLVLTLFEAKKFEAILIRFKVQ